MSSNFSFLYLELEQPHSLPDVEVPKPKEPEIVEDASAIQE